MIIISLCLIVLNVVLSLSQYNDYTIEFWNESTTSENNLEQETTGNLFTNAISFFTNLFEISSACTVNAPSSTNHRNITFDVNCPDANWFKISEDSNFFETAPGRVKIDIDYVSPDKTFADISVTYPYGVDGNNEKPFYIQPAKKEIKVLAVRYVFEDNNGNIAGIPNYMTDKWLEKMVFSNSESTDGQSTVNSIKKYVEQETYGRVNMTGETYPEVVRLNLTINYDPLNLYPNVELPEQILEYINNQDPTFLINKGYDFLIGFSPDHYASKGGLESLNYPKQSSYEKYDLQPSIKGYIGTAAPSTNSSILNSKIYNEKRTSFNKTTVTTRYSIKFLNGACAIDGVWLATDTSHTGINYYNGGVCFGNSRNKYLNLGTPLPQENTKVIIIYTPDNALYLEPKIEKYLPPNTLIYPNRWQARFFHELHHALTPIITFTGIEIGDIYKKPGRLEQYDLMAKGSEAKIKTDLVGDGIQREYYEPSYISGYSKMAAEFVFPYTLKFGENKENIRLYKTEEDEYSNTNERIKLIKVPLRPPGDIGFKKMVSNLGDEQYAGEEYLLLEWRYKGYIGNGRNFDLAIPSEGLLITHVINNNPYQKGKSLGYGNEIVSIIDATPLPNQEQDFTDNETSPAPFGIDSGVFAYSVPDFWQEKDIQDSDIQADFFLSESSGNKLVYIKIKDSNGNQIKKDQFSINSNDDSSYYDRNLSIRITSPSQNKIITSDVTNVNINIASLNKINNRFDYYDSTLKKERQNGFTTDLIYKTDFPQQGFHSITYVVYDEAGQKTEDMLSFYINNMPGSNQYPTADAGEYTVLYDRNRDNKSTVVLDAKGSFDNDGIITSYEWRDSNGNIIFTKPVTAFEKQIGAYIYKLKIKDNLGKESDDSVLIYITNESEKSKIVNDNNINISGVLSMNIQKLSNNNWIKVSEIISNNITIPKEGYISLLDGYDNLGIKRFIGWNEHNMNIQQAGRYRVYVLVNYGTSSIAEWKEFSVN